MPSGRAAELNGQVDGAHQQAAVLRCQSIAHTPYHTTHTTVSAACSACIEGTRPGDTHGQRAQYVELPGCQAHSKLVLSD